MEDLLGFIRSLTEFSDAGWTALQPALSREAIKKDDFLLKEGTPCDSLFYISRGYCRSYYEIEGVERNIAFYFENEIATNIESFGNGKKSEYNIIACEPMKIIRFDKEKLFQLSKQAPEIETLGRACIRAFAARQEGFSTMLKLYAPAERLAHLEKHFPEMVQRVPLSQLASFLGVARETLSRIRKRRSVL
jgi:CRP-like cAMP-binding protein